MTRLTANFFTLERSTVCIYTDLSSFKLFIKATPQKWLFCCLLFLIPPISRVLNLSNSIGLEFLIPSISTELKYVVAARIGVGEPFRLWVNKTCLHIHPIYYNPHSSKGKVAASSMPMRCGISISPRHTKSLSHTIRKLVVFGFWEHIYGKPQAADAN